MKTLASISALAAMAFLLSSPARASDEAVQARERAAAFASHTAARFAFLVPGRTHEDEVIRRAGSPEIDYDTDLLDGDLDPYISPPVPGATAKLYARARREGLEVVGVHVLEYELGGDDARHAVVVVAAGVVLYAVIPPAPAESTVSQAEDLFGPGTTREERRQVGDRHIVTTLLAWPAKGVEFSVDGDSLSRKIVFLPVR